MGWFFLGFSMLKSESQLVTFPKFGIMPVDFTSYLLSSSPPASSFDLLNFSQHLDNTRLSINGYVYNDKCVNSSFCALKQKNAESKKKKGPDIRPIITNISNGEEDSESSPETNSQPTTPPTSPGKLKKKVSFADHRGMALASVKIMTEPSDVPPKLKLEVLAAVRQGATADVSDQPPLVLKFPQPASDYLAFRDQLDKNCVTLENVILRDYKVLGTMKVKNISFEKRVSVRVSFDSWETFSDFEGTYVHGQPSSSQNIDTFSFEFDVPTNLENDATIEFAVFYEANATQYWDNRNGENYKITMSSKTRLVFVPSDQKSLNNGPLHNVDSWSEFAAWNKVDTSIPYW